MKRISRLRTAGTIAGTVAALFGSVATAHTTWGSVPPAASSASSAGAAGAAGCSSCHNLTGRTHGGIVYNRWSGGLMVEGYTGGGWVRRIVPPGSSSYAQGIADAEVIVGGAPWHVAVAPRGGLVGNWWPCPVRYPVRGDAEVDVYVMR